MDHALAVVGPTERAKALVREAGELAAGVGADLTLLHVTTEEEYDERREQLARVTNAGTVYGVGQAVEGARSYASDVGRETLEGLDVDYEAVGSVGDPAETVLAEVDRRGCDHVFITGPKRTPAGKALFGDVAQRVILDAAMPVTVITR